MAREGLMDDTGYHGFDYEPPCLWKECKHEGEEVVNGKVRFKCLNGVCKFEEKENEEDERTRHCVN